MTQLQKLQKSVGLTIPDKLLTSVPNSTKTEVSIYNAHTDIGVKKLKNFDTLEDLALMNSYIMRWAKNFGLAFPSSDDLNMFSNFIRKNYPTLNIIDIDECINLATTDSLHLPKDVKPYGELSCFYISRVLNAYKLYKNDVVAKVRKEASKLLIEENNVPSEAEQLESFKQILILAKETLNSGRFYYDSGNILFMFIYKNKLVNIEELSEEALKYGERQFNADAKKTVDTATSKVNKRFIEEINLTKRQKIVNYAKKYVVNDWIKKTDIQLFINLQLKFEML